MTQEHWRYDLDERRIYMDDVPLLECCAEIRNNCHSRAIDTLMVTITRLLNQAASVSAQAQTGDFA